MILDTHVHVIADDEKKYPKHKNGPPGQQKWPAFTGDMLIAKMDECGVDKALTVQAYWWYEFDNSYAIDMALKYPKRFESVIVLDPRDPKAPDTLTKLVKEKNVKGLRVMRLAEDIYRDPKSAPTWKRTNELKIPLVLGRIDPPQVPDLKAILDQYPQMQITLDHSWASPALETLDPPYKYFDPLMDLARYPNLFLKVCPNLSHDLHNRKADPKVFWGMVVEHFGADRMMWGSNYPAHWNVHLTIKERLAIMRGDLAFLSKKQQDWIFGESALRLWPGLR
jgi:predicted TIM-barrel fold metal-dependent hydrolase